MIIIILQEGAARRRVSTSLRQAGHIVVEAANSNEAIDHLRTDHVELVITEVKIGQIDGWRLSRLIRSGVFTSAHTLPILLVTESYCERIAETTARMFGINKVISFDDLDTIPRAVSDLRNGNDSLNTLKRILVIEDTEDTANLIVRILKNRFRVDLAANGMEGIEKFQSTTYDIILLDIMMPGMSGEEVLDKIIEMNPSQVVIAMTAHGTINLAELLLRNGASDYITKPFKSDQLRSVCDIAAMREDFLVSTEQFSANAIALEDQQQKYESLSKNHYRVLDSLNTIVIELTESGRISFLNNAWSKATGFTVAESIGQPFTSFVHESNKQNKQYISESISSVISQKVKTESLEFRLSRKNKDFFWALLNLAPHQNTEHRIIGISGTIEDIGDRKQSEEKLQYVALHDALTGLRNRYYFDHELRSMANLAKRTGNSHALLYIDLDHFKVINDSQGHHKGDLVLKEIASLLQERTRDSDVLCRIGGDEFAAILVETSIDEAKIAAQEICKVVADSVFQISDHTYKVSCSIGLAQITGDEPSNEIYLQHADIAMLTAKKKGRNRAHIFSMVDQDVEELKYSFEWSQKLQEALAKDNIILHFQPIICVATREVVCYEALVRLVVDRNLIYPDSFIPFLEKAEEMSLLDRHVIDKAFGLMQKHPILTSLAINLSAQSFTDDRLIQYIQSKLEFYGISPGQIIFELTESASLSNISGTRRTIVQLNELGCQFSIDDFGTGFSTFAYLKQIPANSVKIDGSFVKDMLINPIDHTLVKAIHEISMELGKTTVAEFVESEEVLEQLEKLGVHYAQGFSIGRPVEVEALYEKQKTPVNVS